MGMGLCVGEGQLPFLTHFELPAIYGSKLFVAARLPARPFILNKTGSFAVCISNHLPIIDSVRISISSVHKYLYKSVLLGPTGIVRRQNWPMQERQPLICIRSSGREEGIPRATWPSQSHLDQQSGSRPRLTCPSVGSNWYVGVQHVGRVQVYTMAMGSLLCERVNFLDKETSCARSTMG